MWYRRGQTFTIRISKHYYYSVSYKTAVWTTCTQEGYENAASSFTSGPKSTQSWFNRKSYYPMTQSTCQKEQAKLLCPKISYSNSMNMRRSFLAFMGRGFELRIRFSFKSRYRTNRTRNDSSWKQVILNTIASQAQIIRIFSFMHKNIKFFSFCPLLPYVYTAHVKGFIYH